MKKNTEIPLLKRDAYSQSYLKGKQKEHTLVASPVQLEEISYQKPPYPHWVGMR